MTSWQIVAGATVAYVLCAIGLVIVIDGHHPLTHLLALLRRIGGIQ